MQNNVFYTISDSQKEKIKQSLEKSYSIIQYSIVKLYIAANNEAFKETGIQGILVLIINRTNMSLMLRIYELYKLIIEFEIDIYRNINEKHGYEVIKDTFHTLQFPFGFIGLSFVNKSQSELNKSNIINYSRLITNFNNKEKEYLFYHISNKNLQKPEKIVYENEIYQADIYNNLNEEAEIVCELGYKNSNIRNEIAIFNKDKFNLNVGSHNIIIDYFNELKKHITLESKANVLIKNILSKQYVHYNELKRKTILNDVLLFEDLDKSNDKNKIISNNITTSNNKINNSNNLNNLKSDSFNHARNSQMNINRDNKLLYIKQGVHKSPNLIDKNSEISYNKIIANSEKDYLKHLAHLESRKLTLNNANKAKLINQLNNAAIISSDINIFKRKSQYYDEIKKQQNVELNISGLLSNEEKSFSQINNNVDCNNEGNEGNELNNIDVSKSSNNSSNIDNIEEIKNTSNNKDILNITNNNLYKKSIDNSNIILNSFIDKTNKKSDLLNSILKIDKNEIPKRSFIAINKKTSFFLNNSKNINFLNNTKLNVKDNINLLNKKESIFSNIKNDLKISDIKQLPIKNKLYNKAESNTNEELDQGLKNAFNQYNFNKQKLNKSFSNIDIDIDIDNDNNNNSFK